MPGEDNRLVAGHRLLGISGHDGAGGFGLGNLYDAIGPSGERVTLKLASLKALPAVRVKERNQHPKLVQLFGYWVVNNQGEIVHTSEESQAGQAANDTYSLVIATDLHVGIPIRIQNQPRPGKSQIPLADLLGYQEDIASAVDFLTVPKFVEGMGRVMLCCDVTPSAIMLTPQGARLDDLHSSISSNLAEPDGGRSFSAYSAPENIEGSPGSPSAQYALAMTYYHLRTGSPPFAGTSLIDIIKSRLKNELNLSGLQGAEKQVITRALSLNPNERYRSCSEMVRSLCAACRAEA